MKISVEIKQKAKIPAFTKKMRRNLQTAVSAQTAKLIEEIEHNIEDWYVLYSFAPISDAYRDFLADRNALPHDGLISVDYDHVKLINSIESESSNFGLTSTVFTTVAHAEYIENGTDDMPARPFFTPAVEKRKDEIIVALRKASKITF
jgi:HK97 gp10 family phage protein